MSTILYCNAVPCTLDRTQWIGTVQAREKTDNGFKKLWIKRSPKKYAFTTIADALEQSINMAKDFKSSQFGVNVKITYHDIKGMPQTID
jgi:hypothetical protein